MSSDWVAWHERYERAGSPHARRLEVVRSMIRGVLDTAPSGPIRVLSLCAGDGRDLLGVLAEHPRARDVTGRLVELDPVLAERARASAPPSIEVRHADAGTTDAADGIAPVDLLLCCGIFGNVAVEDVQRTIRAWRMLCRQGGLALWTRHGRPPDLRPRIREWVTDAGLDEVAYDGPPGGFGVGLARNPDAPEPFRPHERLFTFVL